MMNRTLKSLCKVSPGTIIDGKWHHNRYAIVKELGFGATGVVYLAQSPTQMVALKLSDNSMSITSEVNVLKAFAKVQGIALGPSLLDVDDWVTNMGKIPFYVMEYIKGPDLLSYIRQKGHDWTNVFILQLLTDLEILHRIGWVFGDLKPENLIVSDSPAKIRCIDVGGTTMIGRAIKEYTEFYDRGYWGLGSRKAEPSYDLFAVAMIILNTVYPNRFKKTTGGMAQLKNMIRQKRELSQIEGVLLKALQGKFTSARQMRAELLRTLNGSNVEHSSTQTPSRSRQQRVTRKTHTHSKSQQKGGILETLILTTVIISLYIFYIFGQLL